MADRPVTHDTLVALLRGRAETQADQPAFHFLGDGEAISDSLTYGQLHARATLIAARLRQNLASGERGLLLYPSGLDYVVAFFACLYADILAVPAYPPTSSNPQRAGRLLGIVRDASPKAVLTDSEGAGRLDLIQRQHPELKSLAVFATDHLDESGDRELTLPQPRPDDLAFLQYTSGSIGSPKGVMVNHANLMTNEAAIQAGLGLTSEDIGLSWLPFYHDMGLIGGILQPVYTGFPMLLMSPMRFLQHPLDWLTAISSHRVTLSGGPNFAYELCVRKIKPSERPGLDLRSWTVASNGSEPIHPQTMERFTQAFAPCGFTQAAFYPCYGLAEATLFVAGPARGTVPIVRRFDKSALQEKRVAIATDDKNAVPLPACGRSWGDHTIAIVEPRSGEPCNPGRIGEIWVSGASVAQGYWNQPEETEHTFRAYMTPGGGSYLRTGDLGFIHEGELFISGRLKDLIIIRGRNYHPQDIERVLDDAAAGLRPRCSAAFSVTIDGEERLVVAAEVQREVIKQDTDEREALMAAIRTTITERCELEVFAVVLIVPGSIPKTSSGKIRRQACKAGFEDGTLAVVAKTGNAPSSAVPRSGEEKNPAQATLYQEILAADSKQAIALIARYLADQITRLTGVAADRIALELPITRLGLDSLKAVELKYEIDDLLRVDLPLALVLDGSSIIQLAEQALAGVQARHRNESARPGADQTDSEHETDLSCGQQAIWLVHQLDANGIVYNLHLALRIRSSVDVEVLRRCLQALTQRHEALRTTYATHQDKPVVVVAPSIDLGFRQLETSGALTEAMRQAHLAAEIRRPFDLRHGPLLRTTLFTHAVQDHTLLFCAHHIAMDFWSLAILVDELKAMYAAARAQTSAELSDCGVRYRDFVVWQQQYVTSEAGARAWEYWRQQLAGKLPILNLPTDRPRPSGPTYQGAAESLRIDPKLARALKSLAERHNVTLYVVLLAAFKTLLFRYTEQDDLIVASPTAGRTKRPFARVVGHFVNPVALRTRPHGELAFEAYLGQVRQTVLEALEYQDYPFSLLVKRLAPERELNRWPLYQVSFVLQRAQLADEADLAPLALGTPGVCAQWGEWDIESVPLDERVEDFDLTLMMAEHADHLLASFQYSTALFDRSTIVRLAAHFKNLLEGVVADPGARLSDLPLLEEPERYRLLTGWNATQAGYPRGKCIHELFEAQVAKTPDALAVAFEDQQLTYKELNGQANQLAHYLRAQAVGPEVLVGLCVERSLELVIGILGILKSGGAYLPLDPSYPQARLAYMVADANAQVIVTQTHWLAGLPTEAVECVCLDRDWTAPQPDHKLVRHVNPSNAAYVIYTSGSTGRPKGVVISHQAAVNLAYGLHRTIYAQQPQGTRLRVSLNAPLAFDASVQQLLMLLFGHALHIVPERVRGNGEAFLAWLEEHAVDVLDCTPTQLKLLLSVSAQKSGSFAPRTVLVGGEAIAAPLWQTLAQTSGTQFYNVYGPTECTVDATTCRVQPDTLRPHIGRPLANVRLYVLDGELNPVPVGVTGELYIGGAGLARGYLKRPDLTAERFVPNPFSAVPSARLYRTGDRARYRDDGSIEYLDRLDRQLKIRGFRIEPAEIETALCAHPQVREAVVIAREDRPGDKRLVAYVVGADQTAPEDEILRAHLRQTLPAYMAPSAFVWLEALPLTPHGKVDRQALPTPEAGAQFEHQYAAPRTPTEQVLCGIWAEALGVERIGIHDNFFVLGGDSILSIQTISRARQAGLVLTPQQLFEQQTVAGLAQVAGIGSMTQAEQGPVTGKAPLTPIQHWFFEQAFLNPHHWNQELLLEAKEPLNPALVETAIEHVLRHHDALRLRFTQESGRWRQVNDAQATFSVLRRVDLADATVADQRNRIGRTAASLQAELDISKGPLLRAVLFEAGAEQPAHLLMVIHHLVVDGVSWRVLLEDVQTAYRQLAAQQTVALPAKTTSYQRWAEQLQAYARSEAIQTETDFWVAQVCAPVEPLPVDNSAGDNTEAFTETITVSLTAEDTGALLQEALSAYRTEINDLLLTALTQTLCQWSDAPAVWIELEGHGREALCEDIDVSRTVGWFTSLFPVRLEISHDWSPGTAIKSIKEQLRRVPRKGLSYGLRYLDPAQEIAEQLTARVPVQVSFNYLGQLDRALPEGALFSVLTQGAGRDPRNRRTHELAIDSCVQHGQLQLNWSFSRKRYRRATITALSQACLQRLQRLIAHCLSTEAGGYTPADFPDIDINQATLDRALENID